ncbi:hypothetical protein MNQ98_24530 [Paenibacillus sp. N3/727]|uniref:hypothetical protein n=1 Tax=Paenibacillus sp. N3/727 TaxID=2925845 RepID=UPI001F534A30|nr:hypothetical protein [Paenibacillus sp. N3/727]UNK17590.1 hypothetical protein MNQ98_24530 [Paenibacillus sp. N3/727]
MGARGTLSTASETEIQRTKFLLGKYKEMTILMQGYSYKETILFFRHGLSDSTIRRKLTEGTESTANSLKLMGFFEQDDSEF